LIFRRAYARQIPCSTWLSPAGAYFPESITTRLACHSANNSEYECDGILGRAERESIRQRELRDVENRATVERISTSSTKISAQTIPPDRYFTGYSPENPCPVMPQVVSSCSPARIALQELFWRVLLPQTVH
jgi:hypothetical protein